MWLNFAASSLVRFFQYNKCEHYDNVAKWTCRLSKWTFFVPKFLTMMIQNYHRKTLMYQI